MTSSLVEHGAMVDRIHALDRPAFRLRGKEATDYEQATEPTQSNVENEPAARHIRVPKNES